MGRPAVLVEGWDRGLEAKALASTKGRRANMCAINQVAGEHFI